MGDVSTWGPPWAGAPWAGAPWAGSAVRQRAVARVVALVLLVVQLGGSTAAATRQPQARALDVAGYLLLALGPLALLVLPRHRVAVAAVAVGAAATYLGLGYPRGPVVASAGLALVVAVASGRRVAAWLVAGCGYALTLGLGAVSDHPVGLGAALAAAAWLLVLLLVGELPRRRAEQFAAARRARAAEQEAAVGEERLALARDLHDTIGHSLSLIAVQAGVALHLLDEHPEQARPALTAIRDASRDALEEVRTVLAVLRAEGDVPRTPAPALGDVKVLVAQARAGGLQVDLAPEAVGDLAIGVPGPVQAAAYRVVQESLTNVSRHAGAASATVRLRRGPAALEVEVSDDGTARAPVSEGRGLLGMRERARALGGTVDVAVRPSGGLRVAVRFPLTPEQVPA
ncbi:sensor histidine kinase [Angustibacter luteus]|uniref:histidine kinase n=1 Tax=Angustibacter luteus TaxID=658456 RepID=A0ABW1JGH9_9ACTN